MEVQHVLTQPGKLSYSVMTALGGRGRRIAAFSFFFFLSLFIHPSIRSFVRSFCVGYVYVCAPLVLEMQIFVGSRNPTGSLQDQQVLPTAESLLTPTLVLICKFCVESYGTQVPSELEPACIPATALLVGG